MANPFISFWTRDETPTSSLASIEVDAKTKAKAEVDDYLSHRPVFPASNIDPFEFWRAETNSTKYPLIKKLAMKYLSAPATSSECERLFSTAGIIIGDLRRRLTAENLEKLLFLHHNIKILGFQETQ